MESLMLNQMYKRLLLVAIVVGPIFWLVFTEDGQRRSDAVLLWLLGKDEMRINLKALSPALKKSDIEKVYANINWQCTTRHSAFGDSLCAANIGLYNDIPAKYITLFFADDRLNGLKLEYLSHYHDQILKQLYLQLGKPEQNPADKPGGPVYRWLTEYGMVIAKKKLQEGDEPALLWLPMSMAGVEN